METTTNANGIPSSAKNAASFSAREDSTLHEECGVVGAFSFSGKSVSAALYNALFALQHRG